MKDSVDEAETGSGIQRREWGELVNHWVDLGFQFPPYQPGPTVYPGGIVDPSFLALFSSSYEVLETIRKENGVDSPWPDHCPELGNHSAVGTSAMRKFFTCIEDESKPAQGLFDGLIWGHELTNVFLKEEKLTRGMLAARISVVLRCEDILASFRTTIDEDRELLRPTLDSCTQENSSSCRSSQTTSNHLQLTWRYSTYHVMDERWIPHYLL